MEQAMLEVPLCSLPWWPTLASAALARHPTITPTWRVCRAVFDLPDISSTPFPVYPIWGNMEFPTGLTDRKFVALHTAKVYRASHFIRNAQWHTASQICQDDKLQGLGVFGALQLSLFLGTLQSVPTFEMGTHTIWTILHGCGSTTSYVVEVI